jgi:type IV pilus biogenesis protein CpaD/CtpE
MKTIPCARLSCVILSAELLALASGCATNARPVFPPASDSRAQFGRIVVETRMPMSLRLEVPETKSELTGQMAATALGFPGAVVKEDPTLILLAVLVPAALVVGTGHGLLAGESAKNMATAVPILQQAAVALHPDAALRDRVLNAIRHEAPAVTLAPARNNADSVLELTILTPGLFVSSGSNYVRLIAHVRVQLLAARDGRELYYDYLEYQSDTHRLAAWAEQDAHLFRDQFDRAIGALANEIAAQVFTRPADLEPDETTLTAVGVRHRPAISSHP